MFVLDASIAAPWILPDEQDPFAEDVFLRMQHEGVLVPQLWYYEIGNLLITNERRKRISREDSDGFLLDLSSYRIRCDQELESENTVRIARHYNLTFYDAAYLEIAVRLKIPLATLDWQLAAAAKKAKVEVLAA